MEKSTGPTGLPRSSFADEFFDTAPFRNFDPQPGFPRRSTERGRFFEDDVGRFFDEFPVNDATRNFHEPAVFRSSLPRGPFPSSNRTHSGMERPIPVQRQQTTPQSSPNSYRKNTTSVPHYHQRSKSHHEGGDHWQQPFSNSFEHNNDDSHSRQFPPSSHPNDPNVHIINIRHEPTTQQQPKQPRFVEINNAQPNYANRTLNPDKRPRFSGQISQNDHNYANIRSSSIPNITVEDYGDGKSASRDEKEHIGLPPVIPLPAPAIPLPAPEHMIQIGNGKQEEMEGLFGNNEEELKKKSLEEEKQDKAMTHDFESVKVEEPKTTNAHLNFEPLADTGENLIRLLDETEQQVEMLRDTAMRMEQEKESLLDTIKNIKLTGESLKLAQGDRDELELNAERILLRCKAVDVYVNTPRNEQQSNALKHVNYIIQNVVDQMEENLASAKAKTNGYLNACDPNESGHIDAKFQLLVIECTADDQKKIRRRLVHILKQIEQAEQLMP